MTTATELATLDAELRTDGHPAILDKREAAKLLRAHPRSLDRWIAQGLLNRLPGGGRNVRFRRRELARFLLGAEPKPTKPLAQTRTRGARGA